MTQQPTSHEIVDDVPPRTRRRNPGTVGRYQQVDRDARQNPGKYVVVKGFKGTSIAAAMRRGEYVDFNPDEYEIVPRRSSTDPDPNIYDYYFKYTGE